ncbi:30S ribosomal protein S17 [Patescibacteria group bacterium]|nr:30S ribosomal protein S17 [Patescibacteria group bacterium]
MQDKKNRKILKGVVLSDKSDKTVVVLVNRLVKHKRYGKFVKLGKKHKAHDEKNEYKAGDKVVLEACRPISKDKHFKVLRKI